MRTEKLTWKFWTWPRLIRSVKADFDKVDQLFGKEIRKNKDLRERVNSIYSRTPAPVTDTELKNLEMQRLVALAGTSPDHPLWQAVLTLADEHERNEVYCALMNNLDDAGRHYNSGRAAGARDFASQLRDQFIKAHQNARKMEEK